jgi:LPS-assembly lipoprotein
MATRAPLLVAAALLACAGLGGCGFTPLYATPGVTPALQAVDIITPEGRTGHLLAEDLATELAVRNDRKPLYQLNMQLVERRYARGLKVEDVASWYELSVDVNYSLVDIASGKTIKAGKVPVSVSYNAVRDPYAGVVAAQDGQTRAASEAATRLRLELSAFFAERATTPAPAAAPSTGG